MIRGKMFNNIRYADDTLLMAENLTHVNKHHVLMGAIHVYLRISRPHSSHLCTNFLYHLLSKAPYHHDIPYF